MGVDISHLVLVALGDAGDEVADDGLDGAEGGNVLAAAVVDLDIDGVFARQREAGGQVREIFGQFACPVAAEREEAGVSRKHSKTASLRHQSREEQFCGRDWNR